LKKEEKNRTEEDNFPESPYNLGFWNFYWHGPCKTVEEALKRYPEEANGFLIQAKINNPLFILFFNPRKSRVFGSLKREHNNIE